MAAGFAPVPNYQSYGLIQGDALKMRRETHKFATITFPKITMLPANYLWLSGFLLFRPMGILGFWTSGTLITSGDRSIFFDPKSLSISGPFRLFHSCTIVPQTLKHRNTNSLTALVLRYFNESFDY